MSTFNMSSKLQLKDKTKYILSLKSKLISHNTLVTAGFSHCYIFTQQGKTLALFTENILYSKPVLVYR